MTVSAPDREQNGPRRTELRSTVETGTALAALRRMDGGPEGRDEPEPLEKAVSHVLEEARMIVPGIQALFGFQLVAVYNAPFFRILTRTEQRLHLVFLCWIALAIGLVMTPAAYHRLAERGRVTTRLVTVASRMIQGALLCLAFGIGLDLYLIGMAILGTELVATALAVGVTLVLLGLWGVYPRISARRRRGEVTQR